MAGGASRERGFALIIVLWTLVLVSLLLAGLAAGARSDLRLTANLRRAAELESAADGAINQAIFGLLRPGDSGWAAGARRALSSGGASVQVAIDSQAGLVNPNVVQAPLMSRLLVRLGVEPETAGRVAAAIVDWRTPGQTPSPGGAKAARSRAAGLDYGPPGAPFESLGELRRVLGMTPALLAAVTPYLTLWWDGDPDPSLAEPVVLLALRDVYGTRAPPRPGERDEDVVTITARARDATGGQVARRAVVRVGFSPDGRNWRVLLWETVRG